MVPGFAYLWSVTKIFLSMICRQRLSDNEKTVLKAAAGAKNHFIQDTDTDLPLELFAAALLALQNKGMAYGHVSNQKGQCAMYLSDYGMQYLSKYPRLRNPGKWKAVIWWIGSVLAIASTILSIYNFCK